MLCQHCDGLDTHDIVTYHGGSKRPQDSDGQRPHCMMNKLISKRKIDREKGRQREEAGRRLRPRDQD